MASLSIGQMAKLSGASVRALRLYHEKGLLEPTFVDEDTGYRRYSLSQTGKLSCIEELKAAGMTLSEIADIAGRQDVSYLKERAMEKKAAIEAEIELLKTRLDAAESIGRSCDLFLEKPRCGRVLHQYMEARSGVLLGGLPAETFRDEESDFDKWTHVFVSMRDHPARPSALRPSRFCNYLVPVESIGRGVDFRAMKPMAFVDDPERYPENESVFLPSGQYLMVYHDLCHNEDGSDTLGMYLDVLLDYMENEGYEPMGPLVSEVLFPYMALLSDDPQGFGRLSVPVLAPAPGPRPFPPVNS